MCMVIGRLLEAVVNTLCLLPRRPPWFHRLISRPLWSCAEEVHLQSFVPDDRSGRRSVIGIDSVNQLDASLLTMRLFSHSRKSSVSIGTLHCCYPNHVPAYG